MRNRLHMCRIERIRYANMTENSFTLTSLLSLISLSLSFFCWWTSPDISHITPYFLFCHYLSPSSFPQTFQHWNSDPNTNRQSFVSKSKWSLSPSQHTHKHTNCQYYSKSSHIFSKFCWPMEWCVMGEMFHHGWRVSLAPIQWVDEVCWPHVKMTC